MSISSVFGAEASGVRAGSVEDRSGTQGVARCADALARRSLGILVGLILWLAATGAMAQASAPTLSAISPSSGPTAGGTSVTLTGAARRACWE